MLARGETRVVTIDAHPVVREGLRHILEAEGDIAIVGESDRGSAAARLVTDCRPHLLILDTALPDIGGIDLVRRMRETGSPVPILILTANDAEESIVGALGQGANGYLLKDEAPSAIVEAVRGVARGEEGWLSRRVTAAMVRHQSPAEGPPGSALTNRERDVLLLLARGDDNEQIAAALGIAASTVKNHVTNIYGKLNLRSRAEAVATAWQQGLADERVEPTGTVGPG